MLQRKSSYKMTDERFERWFEKFKEPYTQRSFITSYKKLENSYSELVIRHLLTFQQRRRVNDFIRSLPKMNHKRFQRFMGRFKKDTSLIYRYSYKDFTSRQRAVIQYYLLCDYVKYRFSIRL